jgi:hypothetical protein
MQFTLWPRGEVNLLVTLQVRSFGSVACPSNCTVCSPAHPTTKEQTGRAIRLGYFREDGTVSKMISGFGVPSPEILNKRFEDMPGRPFHFGLIFYDRFCGERFRNCLPPVLDRCGGVASYFG